MISALHNGRMAMRVLPGQAEEPPDVSLSAIESIVGVELECAPDPDIEGSEPIEEAREDAAGLAPPSPQALTLQLPDDYLAEARRVRESFTAAERDATPAERLLEGLISSEVPIAMGLGDAEGALVALLQRTVADPRLAAEVARTLKETVALHSAVRRRIENSLNAVAGLRAQRIFLEGRRAGRGI